MMEQTLYFKDAAELSAIVGPSQSLLHLLEKSLNLSISSRDLWVKLEGEESKRITAVWLFDFLRKLRGQGALINANQNTYILDQLLAGKQDELESMIASRLDVSPRFRSVSPRTLGQARFIHAIKRHDITFGIGPAGTGKTYLAMATAVSAFLSGEVSRIILTRPAIEAGEALGFLPGDLHQKILPYLRPLYDALYDMMDPETVKKHIEQGVLEIAPLAYMRGRTLNQAFVILDEAQNTTPAQMFMFLTRLGREAKAVISGDITQTDLPKHQESGLSHAKTKLSTVSGIAFHEFDGGDVVRHSLVRRIIASWEAS